MAKTGGTARLPLPASLEVALAGAGFVRYDPAGLDAKAAPHSFVHRRHPRLTLQATASRIPGDAAVIVQWSGQAPIRVEIDALIRILEQTVADADHPSRRADQLLDELLGAHRG